MSKFFETKYGYFIDAGREFVIKTPHTPKPWVNIICPGDYGVVLSQNGGGYSWYLHATLNRITQWQQDLLKDEYGKFIYIYDCESKKYWSATFKPLSLQPDFYECRHGIGYTVITSKNFNILTELTVFVPPGKNFEIWILKIKNLDKKIRNINIISYIEWCMGLPHVTREFQKLFTRSFFEKNTIFATKTLWNLPNKKSQPMNRSWEFFAFHTSTLKTVKYCLNRDDFFKNNFLTNQSEKQIGEEAIASLLTEINLKPRQEKQVVFITGVTKTVSEAKNIIQKYNKIETAKKFLKDTKKYWLDMLEKTTVETSDKAFDFLTNYWLKYQAISARIFGRTGYYQPAGAYGFRDQLQDSQIFLPLNPEFTKKQILLHSAHQYKDGVVKHWWHPITEEGPRSEHSDDLLWLPFVVIQYLKETADFSILNEKIPCIDDKSPSTIYQHCVKSINKVIERMSPRGIPLILCGDWNDGLATVGCQGKGESVWLGCFLNGILQEWIELHKYLNKKIIPENSDKIITKLKDAINKYCWDGNWYLCATKDNNESVGSKKNKYGKIHLNPQTWSILNNIAPKERIKKILKSLEKFLYRDYGPLLLWPAYSEPDEEIGYLTRYAPGARENGGVYTHAATWAIWMESFLGRNEKAWEIYRKICPIYRGLQPDIYCAEPYVTAGNTDGPNSKHYGRGGWSWYTGSAAWLFKVSTECLLGVKPTYSGLIVQPSLPSDIKEFKMKRFFRNAYYEIHFIRQISKKTKIYIDSKTFDGEIIPPFNDGKLHKVKVLSG